MPFQDQAESLVEKLHLRAMPRPLFIAVAVLLCLVLAVSAGLCVASGAPSAFEVVSQEASSQVPGDAGGGGAAEGAGDGGNAGLAAAASGGDGKESATSTQGEAAEGTPATVSLGEGKVACLCVHVDGAVAVPGVYYLDAGSRVIDAVEAAGGLTGSAQSAAVNLAGALEDGQQVLIPDKDDPSVAASASGAGAGAASGAGDASGQKGGLIDINRATADELTALTGVGEATAEKIVAEREANGPFEAIEDIKRVSGIGDKKFEALKDAICV